jgi:hypothetical protein
MPSFNLNKLQLGKKYNVKVRAVDANGNYSSYSLNYQFTVPAVDPVSGSQLSTVNNAIVTQIASNSASGVGGALVAGAFDNAGLASAGSVNLLNVWNGSATLSGTSGSGGVIINQGGILGYRFGDSAASAGKFFLDTKTGNAYFRGQVTATTLDVGGANGIIYDGSTVTIGTSVVINAGLSVNSLTVGYGGSTLSIANNVSGTSSGIYINPNNYWFTSGSFSVGGSAQNVVWNGSALRITGSVTATTGSIGGFLINANSLVGSTTSSIVGGGIYGGSVTGANISNGSTFSVDSSGNLKATSASISGSIVATSGSFTGDVGIQSPGRLIAQSGSNSVVVSSSGIVGTQSGVTIFSIPTDSTASPTIATFKIMESRITGGGSAAYIVSGSVNDNITIRGDKTGGKTAAVYSTIGGVATTATTGSGFYVDDAGAFRLAGSGGVVSMSNGNLSITGSITATTGSIGGFLIGSASLVGGRGSGSYTGLIPGTDKAFFAGATDLSGTAASVSISNSGSLYAIGASISGTINRLTFGRGGGDVATNFAVGEGALNSNTTGALDLAIGSSALYSNTSGSSNIALGYQSMLSNTTGSYNIAFGHRSMYLSGSSRFNIAIGASALYSGSAGDYNLGIGYKALANNIFGDNNIGIGYLALEKLATGGGNIAIGYLSQNNGFSNSNNISLGSSALYTASANSNNIAIGYRALMKNTANQNIGIGSDALTNNTANYNVAIGQSAMTTNTTGSKNTALGQGAMTLNSNGGDNVAIGYNTLPNNTSGSRNIAIGTNDTLGGNETGTDNIAIGYATIVSPVIGNKSVDKNIAIGSFALQSVSGTNNTAIGYNAANNLTTGNYNTYIGSFDATGYTTTGSQIFISDGTGTVYYRVDGTPGTQTEHYFVNAQNYGVRLDANDTYGVLFTPWVNGTASTNSQFYFRPATNDWAFETPLLASFDAAAAGTSGFVRIAGTGQRGMYYTATTANPSSRTVKTAIKEDVDALVSDLAKITTVKYTYDNDPDQLVRFGIYAEDALDTQTFKDYVYGDPAEPETLAINTQEMFAVILEYIKDIYRRLGEDI